MKYGSPHDGRRSPMKGKPLAERFAAYAEQRGPDECWPWRAFRDEKGYGRILLDGGGSGRAHRVAWELTNGPIPRNMQIHHHCQNPGCVNPAHLELLSPGEHTLIGQTFSGRNARKTHCKRGHPLTPDNIYESQLPGRICKTCARARALARHTRLRAEKRH